MFNILIYKLILTIFLSLNYHKQIKLFNYKQHKINYNLIKNNYNNKIINSNQIIIIIFRIVKAIIHQYKLIIILHIINKINLYKR